MWKLTALCLVCVCVAIRNASAIYKGVERVKSTALAKSFKNNNIVRDVDLISSPLYKLTVKYKNGVNVKLGNKLTPTQVKDKPTVTWDAREDETYMLVLIDPDFPSRYKPIDKEFRHWMVANIPAGNVSQGDEVVEYVGAVPPPGSDFHRYVFLVFLQQSIVDVDSESFVSKGSVGGRPNFSTKSLMLEFEMGPPVAGNWFKAKYDDCVLDIYKQFGVERSLYNN